MEVTIIERQSSGLGSHYEFMAVADNEQTAKMIVERAIAQEGWRDEDDFRITPWSVWTEKMLDALTP